MKKSSNKYHFILYIVMLGYVILMLDSLFFGRIMIHVVDEHHYTNSSYNIVPLRTIISDINAGLFSPTDNLFGNILIFIPLGVYIMLFSKTKRITRNMPIILLVAVFIEATQMLTHTGYMDIDDVFLNSIGGLLGIGIYKLIMSLSVDDGSLAITALSAIVGIPIIIVYIFLYACSGPS